MVRVRVRARVSEHLVGPGAGAYGHGPQQHTARLLARARVDADHVLGELAPPALELGLGLGLA